MRKLKRAALATVIGLPLIGLALYASNAAPISPRLSVPDAATRPYVVKLHARWCPVCLVTKGVWSDIEKAYAGRVNLVVFDFTDDASAAASRAEAARLGLSRMLDEYNGATGLIVVLDGKTKEELASISGSLGFAVYREAIDKALARQ